MRSAARVMAIAAACFWILGSPTTASSDVVESTLVPVNLAPIHIWPGVDAEGAELAFDGTNFLVVWNTGPAVKGALVSPQGDVVEPGIFAISDSGYDPSVAFDGTTFLVVWADWLAEVDVNGEVHAKRVSSSGVVLDSSPIVVGKNLKRRPTPVAFDGTNFVVVWRTASDAIRMAHVSPDGEPQDGDGIDIGGGFYPQIACAGADCLVAWHQNGNGLDVYGRRLHADGSLSAGFPISAETNDQHHVSAVSDGSGYLVSWSDGRSGNQENFAGTYAARIAADGTVLDDPALVVSKYNWIQGTRASAAFDGTNYVVSWSQYHYPTERSSDVYLRRIAPAGGFVDAEPVPVATGSAHQVEPVVGVAANRYVVTMNDYGPPCPYPSTCVAIALLDRVASGTTGPVSVDAGAVPSTWERLTSPVEAAIHTVWAFGDGSAFAGTEPDGGAPPWDQNPLLEWNGAAWSIATMLPDARKYGIWGTGPANVLAIGSGGNIVRWDGTTVTQGGDMWAKTGPAEGDFHIIMGMGTGLWGFGEVGVFSSGTDGSTARFAGSGLSEFHDATCRFWDGWETYWGLWRCDRIRATLDNWDVWGSAPDDVYVVGEFGTVAHFDGSAWSLLPVPTGQSLNGIWGSCAGDVFAVGDYGTILRYDGSTWTEQPSPTTENLYAVAGFDGTHVYAVGNTGTIISFDGTSWTREDSETDNTLEDVAVGESVVWVVGSRDHDWNGVGPGTILRKQVILPDASPPENPILSSGLHPPGTWRSDRMVDVSIAGGCDDGRGIDGFAYAFDHSPVTVPEDSKTIDGTQTDFTGPALADGDDWYVHLRTVDRAGNWSDDATHLGPFLIDGTPPANPVLSAHPSAGVWTNAPSVTIELSGAHDGAGAGVTDYSFAFDHSPTTDPGIEPELDGDEAEITEPLADGIWYFHLRTGDGAGNWSEPAHVGPLMVDRVAPPNVIPFSPSHQPGVPSSDTTVDVKLPGATDERSGVDGFSYSWDNSPFGDVDMLKDVEETATELTSPPLPDGEWWFHVRTVDNAGNASPPYALGFRIDTSQPQPQPQPPPPPQPQPQPQPQPRPPAAVRCVVPNVKGMRLRDAKTAIQRGRCRVGRVRTASSRRVRRGRVISQSQRPGRRLRVRSAIHLRVSAGMRR